MQKELQLKKDYSAVGEEITPALAASFVKSFVEAHPAEIPAYHIGRNIIDQILAQPGCYGIRFYNAINERGHKTLVYVGIDQSGKDLGNSVVVTENGSMITSSTLYGDRAGDDLWETVKRFFGF